MTSSAKRSEEERPHVLVVEDEVHLARLLEDLLAPLAVRVTGVRTGPGALERIRSDPSPRLVPPDVILPGMGGLEPFSPRALAARVRDLCRP